VALNVKQRLDCQCDRKSSLCCILFYFIYKNVYQAAELLTSAIQMTQRHNTQDLLKMYFDRGSNYQDIREYDKALQVSSSLTTRLSYG